MNNPSPLHASCYASAVRQTRHVFVRDLEVMASIGVYEHEKHYEQRIIVSVDLMVRDHYDGQSDQLADVLDYAQIVEFIHSIIRREHMNLIETLAEQIAQSCLAIGDVLAVTVKIEKPDPFPAARSVGVQIERIRPAI